MIAVLRAGLLTTVQDRGRRGMQQHGVATGGVMDANAHRIANLLVGNAEDDATLECTMLGPALEFSERTLISVCGGDLGAQLDGRPLELWRPAIAGAGSVLSFGTRRTGCRAYVAVAGGIDVPMVLGSRSTDLAAGFGGLDGRALRTGDALQVAPAGDLSSRMHQRIGSAPRLARSAGRSLRPSLTDEPVIRVVPGPEHDRFSAASRELLTAGAFEVTARSNRMGLRLTGPALSLAGLYDLYSAPVAPGTIQVPPSGDPIVLMADHQTIGGYPRLASVITVDLPLLAQAAPGTRVRFRHVDVEEAQVLLAERERDLRMFGDALRIHYDRS